MSLNPIDHTAEAERLLAIVTAESTDPRDTLSKRQNGIDIVVRDNPLPPGALAKLHAAQREDVAARVAKSMRRAQ